LSASRSCHFTSGERIPEVGCLVKEQIWTWG